MRIGDVQTGIKIPQSGRFRYPFDALKVGDSFFVECEKILIPKVRTTVLSAFRDFKQRRGYENQRLVSRQNEDTSGIRFWRTE